jgi:hypothetical protein
MKPPCKSASEALAESPVAALLDRARLLGQVTATVDAACRELTFGQGLLSAPRCALQGGIVVITVASPSQAAKLRQRTNQIVQALRDFAPEVTGIRVRLQPGVMSYLMPGMGPAEAVQAAERSNEKGAELRAARQFADDLAEKLHDSPLRDAVLRLQALLRNRAEEHG